MAGFVRRLKANGIRLTGPFGVLFARMLKLNVFDGKKALLANMEIARVDPREPLTLENEITTPASAEQVTFDLVDLLGIDRGVGAAKVQSKLGGL